MGEDFAQPDKCSEPEGKHLKEPDLKANVKTEDEEDDEIMIVDEVIKTKSSLPPIDVKPQIKQMMRPLTSYFSIRPSIMSLSQKQNQIGFNNELKGSQSNVISSDSNPAKNCLQQKDLTLTSKLLNN